MLKKTIHRLERISPWVLLLVLLACGAALRIPGIWHAPGSHPDERHMISVAMDLSWPGTEARPLDLNPNSFAYGSFSYYLLFFSAKFVGLFGSWIGSGEYLHYDNMFVLGRSICVAFGLATIVLTYLLAQEVFRNSWGSLLAAAFLTFNFFHIQLSRFFTSDVILTTLTTAALYSIVKIMRTGLTRYYVLTGLFAGLAIATKISAVYLAAPLAVAWLAGLRSQRVSWMRICINLGPSLLLVGIPSMLFSFDSALASAGQMATIKENPALLPVLLAGLHFGPAILGFVILQCTPIRLPWRHAVLPMVVCAITAVAVALLVQPYALLDFQSFQRDLREQINMVQGRWRPPYTIQYAHTAAYFYHLQQMFWYTLGWPVAVCVAIGVFLTAQRVVKNWGQPEAALLVWVVAAFVASAGFAVKFPRYLLPLYPAMFVAGATLLTKRTSLRDANR